jgi:hypothetical protein
MYIRPTEVTVEATMTHATHYSNLNRSISRSLLTISRSLSTELTVEATMTHTPYTCIYIHVYMYIRPTELTVEATMTHATRYSNAASSSYRYANVNRSLLLLKMSVSRSLLTLMHTSGPLAPPPWGLP